MKIGFLVTFTLKLTFFPLTESEETVKSQCGEEEDMQRNHSSSPCQKKQKIQCNPKRKEGQQCLKMKGGYQR